MEVLVDIVVDRIYPMDQYAPVVSTDKVTEWWYDWEAIGGKSFYVLSVDEESTEEELETEIEYWMNEVKVYGLQDPHRKALMAAVRWMMGLLSNK